MTMWTVTKVALGTVLFALTTCAVVGLLASGSYVSAVCIVAIACGTTVNMMD